MLLTAALLLAALSGCAGIVRDSQATVTSTPELPETVNTVSPQSTRAPDLAAREICLPYYSSSVLNPYQCDNSYNQTVGSLIYEGLFEITPEFEAQPCLCDTWETEDNLIWTFNVREGVLFSNGKELTALDVVYSCGLVTSYESVYASRFEDVVSIVASGENTVVFTLRSANAYLPTLLDMPIIPDGAGDEALPHGTGPYALTDSPPARRLTKNSNWWRGSDLPVDTVALIDTVSQEQTLYDFQTGGVNMVVYDRTGTGTVVYRDNSERYSVGTTTMQYIGFNTDNFFTGETNVRSALSFGIDREAIAESIFEGYAEAAVMPVSPRSANYDRSLAGEYAYTENALQEALRDIGFRDTDSDGILERYRTKFTLDFIVNSENPYKVAAAQRITQTLLEAGVDVKLRVLSWEEYTRALTARNFDMYYGEIKLQSDFDLRSLLYSYAQNNFGAYSNATADELLTGYMSGSTTGAQLYAFLLQSAPIVAVLFKEELVLTSRGLLKSMYATSHNPFYRFTDWVFQDG